MTKSASRAEQADRSSGHWYAGVALRLAVMTVEITTAIETEPWGERYFEVTDPNGVVLQQLVQWVS